MASKQHELGVCSNCSGRLEPRTIRHAVVDGNRVVVFSDVLAFVCAQCGESFFSGPVVDQMNEFVWSLPVAPAGRDEELSVHFHSLTPGAAPAIA